MTRGSDEWVRANWEGDPAGAPLYRGTIVTDGRIEYVERGPKGEVLRYPQRPVHWGSVN